jgi:hypothetical protein
MKEFHFIKIAKLGWKYTDNKLMQMNAVPQASNWLCDGLISANCFISMNVRCRVQHH